MTSEVQAPTHDRTGVPPHSPARVAAAITALALGGFVIGTTEFVTMGLLPDIATGVGATIPEAGHVITAYAAGVVVGAPLIVSLGARLPRRGLALGLVLALAFGNVLTALAPSYGSLIAARFVAGLPHGAYFGVASLIATSLVTRDKRGRAVSSVMLGLAVAQVAGVPASTWLGQTLGWRSAYWAVVALAVVTAVGLATVVPASGRDRTASVRRELGALRRPQVWLTVGIGTVGFGGMFAVYSYVAPTITEVTGLGRGAIPWILFTFGLGSIVGTTLGGRLGDRWLFGSLVGAMVTIGGFLALFVGAAHHPVSAVVVLFLISVNASVLAVLLQLRLMLVAGDAEMLGAALNHSALNIANGLGAWLGGLVIAAGLGYTAPAGVGVVLAAAGLLVLVVSATLERRDHLRVSLSH
ncbi:MAG: MFS transporter [Nocardioidaceae bacterium]|nr:MFS transporter [Nocardioidaceae bacterium]